jgi:hypothetical protein
VKVILSVVRGIDEKVILEKRVSLLSSFLKYVPSSLIDLDSLGIGSMFILYSIYKNSSLNYILPAGRSTFTTLLSNTLSDVV